MLFLTLLPVPGVLKLVPIRPTNPKLHFTYLMVPLLPEPPKLDHHPTKPPDPDHTVQPITVQPKEHPIHADTLLTIGDLLDHEYLLRLVMLVQVDGRTATAEGLQLGEFLQGVEWQIGDLVVGDCHRWAKKGLPRCYYFLLFLLFYIGFVVC